MYYKRMRFIIERNLPRSLLHKGLTQPKIVVVDVVFVLLPSLYVAVVIVVIVVVVVVVVVVIVVDVVVVRVNAYALHACMHARLSVLTEVSIEV